eukprot:2448857-Rhodomonas_salina.2
MLLTDVWYRHAVPCYQTSGTDMRYDATTHPVLTRCMLLQAAHVLTASTHLSNAVFRGLSFQHSRSAAVYFPHGASNVAFEQCSFSGTGTEGLRIENATSRNVAVRDSSFADTGCGGARVEGGDVRTLSGGGHVFDSCAFRQPSQVAYGPTRALRGARD